MTENVLIAFVDAFCIVCLIDLGSIGYMPNDSMFARNAQHIKARKPTLYKRQTQYGPKGFKRSIK